MAKIGPWLVSQFYPLPIFYPINNSDFKSNFECCSELLFQVNKPLILSIGSKTASDKGKSSLLSYVFSIRNPIAFSSKSSFTHIGSIDLYAKTPKIDDKYLIADVHGYTEDQQFIQASKALQTFSYVTILHVTEEDIEIDDAANILSLDNDYLTSIVLSSSKTAFLVLFRDYEEDLHENLIERLNRLLEDLPNYLGLIPVPRIDGNFDSTIADQKEEVKQAVLEKLADCKGEIKPFSIENVSRCYKLEDSDDGDTEEMQSLEPIQQEKDSRLILEFLAVSIDMKQNNSVHEVLFFPFFWIDHLIVEEEKKLNQLINKNHNDINEKQIHELNIKYESVLHRINELRERKSSTKVTQLVQLFAHIISSKDPARISVLAEVINKWKEPIIQPVKQRYFKLSGQKASLTGDNKTQVLEEIQRLEVEICDKDIALDTFIDEIQSSFEIKKPDILNYGGIKQYILSVLNQGSPINLINGKTLKFGNPLLQEIFHELEEDFGKVFVISIIGAQSSAKSTLLNYLFGCGFATSAGRCTKGLYMSLLKHPNGWFIVIIDTEGLLSVVARDQVFDNQIAVMAFSCSHIIIINNKGEINTKLRDLLEICVYALKQLKLTNVQPKIIFALRDMADSSRETQQELFIAMKASLEEAAKSLVIDINSLINLSEDDVFLFPPAFQRTKAENRVEVQANNLLFSKIVLEMRSKIFNHLSLIYDEKPIDNLKTFYSQTESLWNTINSHGMEIMKAKNFLEIELKESAIQKTNEIYYKNKDILVRNASNILNESRNRLLHQEDASDNMIATFYQLLAEEYNRVRDVSLEELKREIFDIEKYGIISNYYNEFVDMVEYNLGWQRQNFLGEWRSIEMNWLASKEKEKLKRQLKEEVDKIIESGGDLKSHKSKIMTIFETKRGKLKKDYNDKLKKFSFEKVEALILQILNHYECSLSKIKSSVHVSIPSFAKVVNRIKSDSNQMLYNKSEWIKSSKYFLDFFGVFGSKPPSQKTIAKISKQFEKFIEIIVPILSEDSTEDAAAGVIEAGLSHVDQMIQQGYPINAPSFLESCLLEAINIQYKKSREAEEAQIARQMEELEKSQIEEENHLTAMIKESKNVYQQGVNTAKKCFREILDKFCSIQGAIMQAEMQISKLINITLSHQIQ